MLLTLGQSQCWLVLGPHVELSCWILKKMSWKSEDPHVEVTVRLVIQLMLWYRLPQEDPARFLSAHFRILNVAIGFHNDHTLTLQTWTWPGLCDAMPKGNYEHAL